MGSHSAEEPSLASAPLDSVMSVNETCDLIAELSESILEAPQQAFVSDEQESSHSSTKVGKKKGKSPMKRLFSIAIQKENEFTSQLAILSLLSIFKDILPTYRIQLPTEQQRAVKVSKDVKRIWDYERDLLQHYQQYLKLLESHWKASKDSNPPLPLAVASMLSLAQLLESHYTFNFRDQLLAIVVRYVNHPNQAIREACARSVSHVLADDPQGIVALEGTRLLCKLIKDAQFRVRPEVLDILASLPLRTHVDEAQAAKLASQARKKRRKVDKLQAEIDQELEEGKATVDKILLARSQSDCLQAILLVYFRILKHDNLDRVKALLPAALSGLAKFAHLINLETVMDMLSVLQTLLKKVDHLPVDAALNAVLTAFLTLQGPGKTLNIDPKEYIMPLYSQLPRLAGCEPEKIKTCLPIALKCLEAAFLQRREYSTTRVAAFVRQIWTVCLHLPISANGPLLSYCRLLIQRYPSTHSLLENELDVVTSGETYNPDVADPEHANPTATSAWELAMLKFSLDKRVSNQAQANATLQLPNLPKEAPDRLIRDYERLGGVLYIPFTRVHKKHPLAGGKQTSSDKRKRSRFVTPRTTDVSIKSYADCLRIAL